MTDRTPRIVTCPTCNKRVKWTQSNPDRPFCSERCRLIDLGAWADEQHAIPGDAQTDDLLSSEVDGD
ncbi:MAG: DNA gyrase inhibitor YacG [Pseudomonadota bacterium]